MSISTTGSVWIDVVVFSVLSAFIFCVKMFICRITMSKRRDLNVEEKLDVLKKYEDWGASENEPAINSI